MAIADNNRGQTALLSKQVFEVIQAEALHPRGFGWCK